MHSELARVAAGVRADLAFERPLVIVDPKVLLQTAAVRCCVRAVLALVRPLARVGAAVHVQFVTPAEALVAELAFKRLLACSLREEQSRLTLWAFLQLISKTYSIKRDYPTGVSLEMSLHVFLAILCLKSATCKCGRKVKLSNYLEAFRTTLCKQ